MTRSDYNSDFTVQKEILRYITKKSLKAAKFIGCILNILLLSCKTISAFKNLFISQVLQERKILKRSILEPRYLGKEE